MKELNLLRCDTISWLTWKKKSEKYKEKVEKELVEFGKMSALCRWWREERSKNGNKVTSNVSKSRS